MAYLIGMQAKCEPSELLPRIFLAAVPRHVEHLYSENNLPSAILEVFNVYYANKHAHMHHTTPLHCLHLVMVFSLADRLDQSLLLSHDFGRRCRFRLVRHRGLTSSEEWSGCCWLTCIVLIS